MNDLEIQQAATDKAEFDRNSTRFRKRYTSNIFQIFLDASSKQSERERLAKLEAEKMEAERLEEMEEMEYQRLEKQKKAEFEKRTRPDLFYISPL